MKQFVYITLLLLCGFLNSHAQEVSPWEEAYNNLPQKHRDEIYEYARDFLENTYYTQMSLAIEEGEMFCVNFIKNIFGDENEADAARFQPEFLIESLEEHFLTPNSYLQTLCNTFEESDELEFIVSNIEEDKYVHGYTSPFNCFTRLDYDLEIKRRGETLLKRRCRMYCLFPVVSYKLEVRLMQIEPLEDFYIASEFFPVSETQLQASDETRFQEAQEWYDQGLTEMYLPVFQELANKGYAAAQYYLGNCYENGIGVSKDGEKAVEWYTKAANQGDANAQKALERLKKPLRCQGFIKNEANIPLAGASVSYNYGTYNKGRYSFRGVSVKTDSNGYFSFGNNLPIGAVLKVTCVGYKPYTFRWEGGLADISLIEVLMCKGIVKNEIGTAIVGATISRDSEVYTSTGIDGRFCLENLPIGAVLKVTCVGYKPYTFRWEGGFADIILIEGDQVSDKAQLQEAVKWYNQGLTEKCLPIFQELAEKGNVMAQFYLGLSYDKGKGVLKNERNAMEWYTKAAEQGHIIAQYNLALCYRYDYKDARTAVEWFTKAAEQGYALAQNSLGYCYETGIGVPIDERKAIEWYTKAAEQGINEAKEALDRLSQQTLSSTTVIDRMWLRAKTDVAEQGDVNAQYELGLGYDKGKRVPKDARKAIEWYTKAAEQGHIIAQYNLALCYRYDYKDARTAVEWYTKAAEQGYALAQNSLGYCYETGIGVPIDERKAIEWYTKAARQGMNEAKDALKRLLVGMEPRI